MGGGDVIEGLRDRGKAVPNAPIAGESVRLAGIRSYLRGGRFAFDFAALEGRVDMNVGKTDAGWVVLQCQAGLTRPMWWLALAGCLTAAVGCGEEVGGSVSADATPEVPPEIASQLVVLEQMMNGSGLATSPETVFAESAQIHLAGRLAYGSREDFAAETAQRRTPTKIEFGETQVVAIRPDRVRTVTSMTLVRGEDRSVERISHEWVPDGERWIAREQSYPDWTPLVGEWSRVRDDGEQISLRMMPNGQFEIRLAESGIVMNAGTYAVMGQSITVVPDAVGAGGTGGASFDLAHRFEFDGSLRFEPSAASAGAGSAFEGVWRRRRLVD